MLTKTRQEEMSKHEQIKADVASVRTTVAATKEQRRERKKVGLKSSANAATTAAK